MPARRWAAAIISLLLLNSLLQSQSLAEIARKERERRAALKGKPAVVVTNAELGKVKRKPAVEVPTAAADKPGNEAASPPPSPAGAGARSATAPAAPAGQPGPGTSTSAPPPAPVPAVAAPGTEAVPPQLRELQERWDKAKEYVELLTLKMGALWQEFNGLRDPQAKEAVRKSISETYAKLSTAQEEETKARLEFERSLGETKKESTPQLWIR